MKDHQPGCQIVRTGKCTCLNTGELEVLRQKKDEMDVRLTVLMHKHHWLRVAFFILLFWFIVSIVFNGLFLFDIWYLKEQ